MKKQVRQSHILEIISQVETETQEELAAELKARGIEVTQATLSRDIRELDLVKISGTYKKHKYAKATSEDAHTDRKLLNLFTNCVLDIINAQNIVVVKTLSGNGNTAGIVVDRLEIEEVVGSVAGDDTLLIVTKNNDAALRVVTKLRGLLEEK